MKSFLFEMTYKLFKGPRESGSRPILGSILGISLSMIPLVVVVFLSDGMIRGITDRYIETGTFHLQLRPYENFSDEEWDSILEKLNHTDEITQAQKEHNGTGIAFSGELQTTVSIRSIDSDLYKSDSGFRKYLTLNEGNFNLEENNSIVIGKETASLLNLHVGENLKILTGKTLSTGKYIPKVSNFIIRGIFSTGYQDLDKLWVFISLEKGLRILQDSESGSHILIKVEDPYGDLKPIMQNIRTIIGKKRWGLYSWQSLNRSQQSNYQTTKLILILIMSLIVLIAVMNISSSMIMLVMENEQDIGILKSMGMNNRFLSLQYILTAGLAGGTGSLIGLLTGSFIASEFNSLIFMTEKIVNGILNICSRIFALFPPDHISLLNSDYYLEDFIINIDISILILIFIMTTFLSMIAALIPIRNISKITPLDILRKH